ncbi:MAG: response regulator [Deltaproteobacteria bacterium]|nr:MAG: response regulator [Deltaproteobacteria bacterium]
MSLRRVLIIEDGTEYIETMTRFLADGFAWERAGSGPAGIERLRAGGIDAVFLDMRFDRAPEGELIGDLDEVAERFSGDRVLARRFVEDHQGTFVLAALREAGVTLPVVLSYDFSGEPRRWERLAERFAPVRYLPDNASPAQVREALGG